MSSQQLTLVTAFFLLLTAAQGAAQSCTAGDFYCSVNCTGIEYCSSSGPILVETCSNVTACNHTTVTCEVGVGVCVLPPTQPEDFRCHGRGYFPDPTRCAVFHFCCGDEGNSTVLHCPSSTAYDPLTSLCSATSTDRVCLQQPIPTCETAGQLGAQQENNNIYYVCTQVGASITPSLFKCPPDQVFEDNKCVSRLLTTTTSTTEMTTTTNRPSSAAVRIASVVLVCLMLVTTRLGIDNVWSGVLM